MLISAEHIFKVCEELGVTYVAFSPLANGFLNGKEAKIEKEGAIVISCLNMLKKDMKEVKNCLNY